MVYFQTKNLNLGYFWSALHRLEKVDIFNGHLEYFTDICKFFMTIWYSLCLFGTFLWCVCVVVKYQETSGNPEK
jgi:hypothetical protein